MEVLTFRTRVGWLVFAFCLIIYLLTLCPTVYWDDAGELIAACYTLGIPHPPGHPLYTIIGKLFTLLPIGTIAWRVNLMSAFFGALSCMLVYRIIIELLDEDDVWALPAACGGAFFFAFTTTMWDQATVAETSTLHSFFMMLLTLFAFRMASGKILWKSEAKTICLFTFLYGLSFTNHVAGLFFFPSFAYVLITIFGKRIFKMRLMLAMTGAFALGISLYAYLPIRSLSDPVIDWGNPESLRNFLWVVTARQYSPDLLTTDLSAYAVSEYLIMRGKDLLHQFTVVGCVFGFVGLFILGRREGRFIVFSFLVIGILFYTGLNTAFISAYFIPAIALMAVWIGVGLQHICGWIEGLSQRMRTASLSTVVRFTLCPLLAAGFVLPLGLHFRDMDRSAHTYALRYGEQMLEELPEGSALFTTDGYALFILWYLVYCEGERPDLMVVHPGWVVGSEPLRSQILEQYPELILPPPEIVESYIDRAEDKKTKKYLIMQSLLDANYAYRPVYWGMIPADLPFAGNLIPRGILYRYSNEPMISDAQTVSANRAFWEAERACSLYDPAMKKDKISLEIYPVELNNQGLLFEQRGRDDLARWAIELALHFNPEYPISRYNLGRLEARAGNYEKAVEEYQHAVDGNPYMAVAYYNLGNAYASLNRYDDAFLAYQRAVRMYKPYHEAITAMGRLYLLAGDNESASGKFRQALEIEPGYVFALRGLASTCLQMDRLNETKEVLDRALEIEPDSAPALLTLAAYYARIGDKENAEDALLRCVRIGGDQYLDDALSDESLKGTAEKVSVVLGRSRL